MRERIGERVNTWEHLSHSSKMEWTDSEWRKEPFSTIAFNMRNYWSPALNKVFKEMMKRREGSTGATPQ